MFRFQMFQLDPVCQILICLRLLHKILQCLDWCIVVYLNFHLPRDCLEFTSPYCFYLLNNYVIESKSV